MNDGTSISVEVDGDIELEVAQAVDTVCHWEDSRCLTVEEWNRVYPIGTKVWVSKDKGTLKTKTRSLAQKLPSGDPVIFVEGIAGCYALERVVPMGRISKN